MSTHTFFKNTKIKYFYISLISIAVLIVATLVINPNNFLVFAEAVINSNEKSKETPDNLQSSGVSLLEDEPQLLARKEVLETLHEQMKVGDNTITSYIDTGFTRKSKTESFLADRVSDIKIHFYVKNDTDTHQRLTINTGIQKGTLKYIRLEGATGFRWDNDELVIAYVPLAGHNSTMVTLTAIPLITHDPVVIETNPVVKNKTGNVVARGAINTKTVRLKPSVDIKGIGNFKAKRAN